MVYRGLGGCFIVFQYLCLIQLKFYIPTIKIILISSYFLFSPLQGLHEKVLEDCEIALRLNENNFRALYRKAKALNELGRYKTAYDAVAKCSLAVPQVGK